MSGYSNYSLHQKYTSVQGQILTLNQQVSNNTNPTLASVLQNSSDANGLNIQNVGTIDSDLMDTLEIKIYDTSVPRNEKGVIKQDTNGLLITTPGEVNFHLDNDSAFSVIGGNSLNVPLEIDPANNKVAIGGSVDPVGSTLQVNGGAEAQSITISDVTGNYSSTYTVASSGESKITAKTGDLILTTTSVTDSVDVTDNTDFKVTNGITEYFKVDKAIGANGKIDMTDTDVNGALVVTGTANTGALTATSLTSSGSLSFSPVGVGDKINLYNSTYSIGIAGGTAFISSVRNIDFVYRADSSDTSTTSKLRFKVDQTNPQIHSSLPDGHIEFWRDANGLTPTKYLTLSSNTNNDTVLTSEGSFSLNTNTTVNGALTVDSISTTGTATTGALTADSISNGGNLTFTSSSFPKLITASTGFEFCENSSTTPFLKLASRGSTHNESTYTSEGLHAFSCNANTTNRMLITNTSVTVANDTDFVVSGPGVNYLFVNPVSDKIDMTNTDVNGDLVVSGTATTGALTADSISTTGTANTGALTADSISTTGSSTLQSTSTTDLTVNGTATTGGLTASSISNGGDLNLTSSGSPLIKFVSTNFADRIHLINNNSIYTLGVDNFAVLLTTGGYIDFVHRNVSTSTNVTPKLRFQVNLTNPQIHSSVTDGYIEFWRDANGTPTQYLTLSSNSSNDTVLTSEGKFALRTSSSSGIIEFCENSSTTPFLKLEGSGPLYNESIFTSEGIHAFRCDGNSTNRMLITNTGVSIPSGNTLTIQTPTANAHASTKLYVDQTFTRVGGTYQQVINAPSTFNTSVTITPPSNCYKMDAIVYGRGGLAGGNLIQGSNIFYGGSGGGGSGSSTSSVPVNTSTSFTFSYENLLGGGTSDPGGILRISSTVLTNYTIVAGVNGGDGSAPVGSAGGAGGSGASQWNQTSHFPFYTFGAGTSGFQGGSQAYPVSQIANLPPGVGVPSVAGGNEGDYGAGQRFAGSSQGAATIHYASPVCIITWYLRPS